MKMSSILSMRVKTLALSGLFALASACSGDKAPADEELDVSGEEAMPADSTVESEPAPAGTTKKAKKGKKGKKGGKKTSTKKPKK